MSLVIAEVTKDGILFTGDKRISRPEGTHKDNCTKVFGVGDRIIVGLVGTSVEHPHILRRLLNKNLDKLEGQSTLESARTMSGLVADHNDRSKIEKCKMKIVIGGYDRGKPLIYEVRVFFNKFRNPINRTPYIATSDQIIYDLSEDVSKVFDEISHEDALIRHEALIRETSITNNTVSATYNSYLLTPESFFVLR